MDSERKVCILPVANSHTAWCVVDRVDWDWAKEYRWLAHSNGYAARRVKQGGKWQVVYLHRQIAERMFGAEALKGMQVDHVDRCVWNNSRVNLRRATPKENARNHSRSRRNTSGATGVSQCKRNHRWRVNLAGKYLGSYATKKAAIEARKRAERDVFGDFAPQ